MQIIHFACSLPLVRRGWHNTVPRVDTSPGLRGREAGPSSVWLLLCNVLQSPGTASAGAELNRHIWSN